MKVIRMTRDCALSFLERQYKGGTAEKLADAFEHLMFREGVISLMSRRTQMVTIVRFLPAMEIENDLLKELHPTMLGGAIRMMLMAPISTGSALLGYFFLVDEQGQNKVVLEYGATKAAYRAFKGTGNQKMSKLRHTITLAKTMRDLILLTQKDMREHEECWSAEEVRERSSKTEIWLEDTFLFSLMCSIAQDESRSISENIRMGYQARYKRGEYNLGNNRILGYDCVCGKLVPNQDAWIVRMVFDLFLEEKTYKEIAESLEKAGAESQRKCGHFSGTIISYILRNETYVGDKRLHKNPPRDFITKKALKDTDFKSIYLTNDHEPIVDRKTWDAVQTILNQREELKKKGVDVRGKNSHFLFGKVKCGECGEYYTRRTFQERRKDENGKPMTYKAWICKEKRKGKKGNGCQNHGIREDVLLQEIAAQLGWDSFDEKRFEEVVECVVVSKSDIYIKMKNE